MSTDWSIICHDCKELLDIAEDSMNGSKLFYGDEELMKQLEEFLFNHAFHKLGFHVGHVYALDMGYKEINNDKE